LVFPLCKTSTSGAGTTNFIRWILQSECHNWRLALT
jgi:hypothetical protein